ncbi:DMT family transporter [Agreia sp. COWG]|uniref:DMT family transporter n=1 Tax=Agreia sp. COWG TaxID=2773266 RepID=UPI001AF92A28|nr:DMT family transporter [Agreia sp. COWG]CAD6007440.1 Permease of the drug/metabolite transporter (DMT) superfamily [Agreia sp. COWG]
MSTTHHPGHGTSSVSAGIQFASMGIVWGASFLFMKVALEGASFGQVAWSRLVLGALALGVVVLVTKNRLPSSPRVWAHFVVVAVSGSVLPYLLFAWAEQYVSSGLASIYNAVTPITTAVMATLVFRVEKLSRAQVLGVIVGILGVVVIIGPWRFAPTAAAEGSTVTELAGQIACLGSAVCYGFTFGYLRRFITGRGVSGVTTAFMQIGLGGAIMLLLTPVVALGEVRLTLPIVLSLLTLGIVGTGFAYLWNINVLLTWGPTVTSTVTYLTPIVGVALGILILGETLSWNEPTGAALVFVGILLAQRRLRLPRRRMADATTVAS